MMRCFTVYIRLFLDIIKLDKFEEEFKNGFE